MIRKGHHMMLIYNTRDQMCTEQEVLPGRARNDMCNEVVQERNMDLKVHHGKDKNHT